MSPIKHKDAVLLEIIRKLVPTILKGKRKGMHLLLLLNQHLGLDFLKGKALTFNNIHTLQLSVSNQLYQAPEDEIFLLILAKYFKYPIEFDSAVPTHLEIELGIRLLEGKAAFQVASPSPHLTEQVLIFHTVLFELRVPFLVIAHFTKKVLPDPKAWLQINPCHIATSLETDFVPYRQLISTKLFHRRKFISLPIRQMNTEIWESLTSKKSVVT